MERQHTLIIMSLLMATIFANNLMEANSKLFVISSVATKIRTSSICSRIPGLSPEQITICEEYPKLINCIREGYQLGAEECKFQFRKNRWNCTVLGQSSDFDDKAIPGTKEAAYTQAIISAGVVYTITRACSMGNLTECNCDRKLWPGKESKKGWMWGGCSVDTSYGINLSSRFVNARRNTHDAIYLVNKHNNKAGRQSCKTSLMNQACLEPYQENIGRRFCYACSVPTLWANIMTVVKEKLVLECKCHGISGTCTTRTCWKALPSLRVIGERLKQYYYNAIRVKVVTTETSRGPKPEYLVLVSEQTRKPDPASLVYIKEFNDYLYCNRDKTLGILGTKDRICNVTTTDRDRCDFLCCEYGYDTHNFTKVSQCKCKFHWCCEVRCKQCVQNVVQHTCK